MLGRKKPAPEPLSLSSPTSSTNKLQKNSSKNIQPSAITSPSPVTTASPRSLEPSKSPASAGLSSSRRSQPGPKRPQTAKGSASQVDDADAASNFEQFSQRRPLQTSYNPTHSPSADPSSSTSPTEQQHPPGSPSSRRVPSNDKKPTGGFFHFNKPSRTANQFPSHNQRPASVSWNRFDSRGTDGPGTAQYGGKLQSDRLK